MTVTKETDSKGGALLKVHYTREGLPIIATFRLDLPTDLLSDVPAILISLSCVREDTLEKIVPTEEELEQIRVNAAGAL